MQEQEFKDIGIIGAGYVGLSIAAALLEQGYNVCVYEAVKEKRDNLKSENIYISEPGVTVQITGRPQRFVVADTLYDMFQYCHLIFVCVGTPSDINGDVDLQYVKQVAKEIGQEIQNKITKTHIILKSTVPPGTTRMFERIIAEHSGIEKDLLDKEFYYSVYYSPEFLAEGTAIRDFNEPDKVVIGYGNNKMKYKVENWLKNYHREVMGREFNKIVSTTWENAEMIKYANNAFLATKITFINQIANICETIKGGDVEIIAKALGMDRRISPHFLRAGLGYGGSCFTKDLNALAIFAEKQGANGDMFESINWYNFNQRIKPVYLLFDKWGFDMKNKTVAILGLTFKPDTDDTRDSPALDIIERLLRNDMKVKVHDPLAKIDSSGKFIGVKQTVTPKEALKDADAVIICTEWNQYRELTAEDYRLLMREPMVIDGRGVINDPESFIRQGIEYYGIGYATYRTEISTTN